MPEQAEPKQARGHRQAQSLQRHLPAQNQNPDQADADMGAVRADQGEEGGQEAAAVGPGAGADHAEKLADLEKDEARAQQEGVGQPAQHRRAVALPRRQGREAEGHAADQHSRLQRGIVEAEELLAVGPPAVLPTMMP
jgi:hypothetical protein